MSETDTRSTFADRFRLDDRVAIVTGAGRGLGAAIAVAFAECGADVVIASRTASQLEEVAETVRSLGRRAVVVAADLSDPEVTADLARTAKDEFGRLDIVVNNVGGTMPAGLLDTSVADLEGAFRFNVSTAHALTCAAVPLMLENDSDSDSDDSTATGSCGSIINITSAVGRLPGRAFAAYGTAKAALAHYTRLAAEDLSPRIRVNAIAPGAIATSALEIVTGDDGMRTSLEKATPLRRIGDPAEVAAAAVYLASQAGAYTTGKILEVDGGIIKLNMELPLPDL